MINKDRIEALHNELSELLKGFAAKHNLKVAKTHITYYPESFRFNAEFGDKSVLGDMNPVYFNDFKKHGWRHGFDAAQMNDKFELNGKTFTIKGMKGKDFVIGEGLDKKLYKFRGLTVAAAMGRKSKGELVTITSKDLATLNVKDLLGAKQ